MAESFTGPPPGTFATCIAAPIYVNGMPLDNLVKALAENNQLLASQKQTAESQFWSTPRRAATDPMREVFQVNLASAKKVNAVAFDLPRFPHRAFLFYEDTKTKAWKPVLNTSKTPLMVDTKDSLPAIITPPPPGSDTHAQHYGAGHWVHHEYALAPLTAARFRLTLVRQRTASVPVDNSRKPVSYSLGVRGFNIGYKIKEYKDVPSTNRSSVVITERESFASTTDILGSQVAISVRENRATDLLNGAIWKSEPQPIPNAVVNLYVDARGSDGKAPVIDRFLMDPITSGVHVNLYYSNETPSQTRFTASDNPISFPLIRKNGVASVQSSADGLVFPDEIAYLDIDNATMQFSPALPFWLGVVIQPQFDYADTTRHVFVDTGSLRLEWTGSTLMATLFGASLVLDGVEFSVNERIALVLSYDGEKFHLYADGEDQFTEVYDTSSSPLPVTSTGMTSLMRLGGLITGDDEDSGHGNFRLTSLVLKREIPPGAETYERYFADTSSFTVEPEFAEDNQGVSDNAILRYDPAFWTPGEGSINQFGCVGGTGDRYKDLTWTPISRDYKLHKGALVFNPTKAKYWKFEFTQLAPQPYDDYEPVVRKVKVFPTAQYYPTISTAQTASGNTAGGGAIVSQDANSTLHYADQVRLYTNVRIAQPDGTYTPTQALYSQNPLVQGRLRENSLYFNLQQWHLSKFSPKFVEVQKHVYEHVEIEHTARVAYFVGLNSISMIRVDYAASDDTDQYLECFQDDSNLAVDDDGVVVSGWTLSDDNPNVPGGYIVTPGVMGVEETVTTSSRTFASRRKVTGLAFATQQTPPVQLLNDPDFNDPGMPAWRAYGDVAQPTVSDDYTTDIGTMIKVGRNTGANYWSVIEDRWATWDAIENSDPDPNKPVWDDLETQQSATSYGGIESVKSYAVSSVGRLYAAARVYVTETVSAPLYIQIVGKDDQVISQEPFTPVAGQVSEWFTSYTVGEGGEVTGLTWDQIEDGGLTPDNDPEHPSWDEMEAMGSWDQVDVSSASLETDVSVRLVQVEPTDDVWYVDNISLFDDAIIWEFSNDSGLTWWPVYDIRNDPHGAFMFPSSESEQAGLGLRWRVTGARPRQQVNSLAIRPFYDSLPLGQPYMETIQPSGPNQSMCDHYPPITDDPRWKLWHKPIPEDWYFTFRQWLLQQHPTTVAPLLPAIPLFIDTLVWREPLP